MDYFTNLSTEITNIILSDLSFNDIIKLRMVNKRIKVTIDNNEEVWKNGKIVIKLNTQSQHRLFEGFLFLHEFGKFDCVELDSPDEIDMNWFEQQLHRFKISNMVKRVGNIKLIVKQININSLGILNLFSDVCVDLTINAFTRKLEPDETNETLYKQLQIKSLTRINMTKLKRLSIHFKVINDYKNNERFEKWIKMIIYSIYRVEEEEKLDEYRSWVKSKVRSTRLYMIHS
jgi:hypothetical protein